MFKKPVISKEAQVLLKLLRIALGTEPRMYFGEMVEPFPDGIDWKEVVRLSYEHKVSALAVDGLEASKYDPYKGLDEKQTEELKAVLVPWIKDVENTEWSYCYYVEVLKTLCQIFNDNGLTPIILKGYGLSLNYPRPSHRGVGDIDLFLIDKDKRPACEKGEEIVQNLLHIDVERPDSDGHSHFEFKGVRVEIHHQLVNVKASAEVELQGGMIEKLCSQSVSKEGENWVVFPSATFNALFLISHLVKHFVHSNIEYRQLVDWGLFVRRYHKDIDWEEVRNELTKVGLYRFMCAANMACISYLGLSGLYVPETIVGDDQRIVMPYWNNGSGIRNFAAHYMNRERSRLLSNEHWLRATIRSIGYRMKIKKKQY